ncbi:tyrosine-type recombinase/integrase [Nocardiopsis sp. CA-288880]|uniref:tyrosine-type recombinase/integrase n=1 Tax=Nocardiopsis sp. CA-288880 TaxID=3239995 RepID=UPI003D96C913
MAYAEKLVKSWRACWYVAGRKSAVKKSGFPTEKAAVAYATEQEVDARRGDATRPEARKLTLRQWIDDEWWPTLGLEPMSMRNYKSILENHIRPTWGSMSFEQLEHSGRRIQAWKSTLAESYSRRYVLNITGLMSTLCSDAVDAKLMNRNPAEGRRTRGKVAPKRVERATEEKKDTMDARQAFLAAERCAVLSGRDDEFVLATAMFYMGLRISEAMGLERDLVSTRASLQYQLHGGPKGAFYRKVPKDGSVRDVDLPPFLRELLAWQAGQVSHPTPPKGARWCPCGDTLEEQYRHPPGVHLFSGPDGSYHWPQGVFREQVYYPAAQGLFYPTDKRFRRPVYQSLREDGSMPGPFDWESTLERRARMEAAVTCWAPLVPGFTPHGMRHSHRSLLDQLGVRKPLMDERMGHSDRSVSASYAHPTAPMRAAMLAGLAAEWEQALEWRRSLGVSSAVSVVERLMEGGVGALKSHSRSTPDAKSRRTATPRGMVVEGVTVLGFSLIPGALKLAEVAA